MDAHEARQLFEAELRTIDSLIASVTRRYGVHGDEAESFASWVRMKLIDENYRVLRQFEGRSSLRTYLSVVVANLYRDYRIKQWGKWRPSAAARRRGRAGILLDTYLNRDGHPLEEAIERVRTRDDVEADEAELREMAAEIPRRTRRTFTDLSGARQLEADHTADQRLRKGLRDEGMDEVTRLLEEAMAGLPDQDQVILKLRFFEGLTVADIARTLELEQKPLYRRIDRNLRRLREALEARGVEETRVAELLPA